MIVAPDKLQSVSGSGRGVGRSSGLSRIWKYKLAQIGPLPRWEFRWAFGYADLKCLGWSFLIGLEWTADYRRIRLGPFAVGWVLVYPGDGLA
jgi:hypothetical protein